MGDRLDIGDEIEFCADEPVGFGERASGDAAEVVRADPPERPILTRQLWHE